MAKKILFVEDEQALHKTLGKVLEKEGFTVLNAEDGLTGLEMAKKEKPDLILLDIILPRMIGTEVLKELKKDPSTKDIPVIILTNLEDTERLQDALSSGAKAYFLKKSYTLEDLARKVKELM